MTNTTYSGKPKPAGRSGHFYESRRHKLQAQGIHTGHNVKILTSNFRYEDPNLRKILARIPSENRRELFLTQFDNLNNKDQRFVINILKDTDGDRAIDLFDCNPYDPTKQDLKEFVTKAGEKIASAGRWIGQEAKIGLEKAKEGGKRTLEWVKKEGKIVAEDLRNVQEKIREEMAIREAQQKLLAAAPVPSAMATGEEAMAPAQLEEVFRISADMQPKVTEPFTGADVLEAPQVARISEAPSFEPTPVPEIKTSPVCSSIPACPHPPDLSEPSSRRVDLEARIDEKAEKILTLQEELQLHALEEQQKLIEEREGLIRPSIFNPVNVWTGEKIEEEK